jgi:hypothetical protein
MERELPVGAKRWDSVTSQFNEKASEGREPKKMSLQHKLNQPKKMKIPNENPNIPPPVAKAKFINELMMQKSSSEVMGETCRANNYSFLNLEDDDDNGDDDEEEKEAVDDMKTDSTLATNRQVVARLSVPHSRGRKGCDSSVKLM